MGPWRLRSSRPRCYQAGASSYVAKPVSIASLGEKLERLGMYLEIVELPAVA